MCVRMCLCVFVCGECEHASVCMYVEIKGSAQRDNKVVVRTCA